MRFGADIFVAFSLVFGLAQFFLIARSMRSGVIGWSEFGRKVRAPGDFDFWAVLILHAILGTVFTGFAVFLMFGYFQ